MDVADTPISKPCSQRGSVLMELGLCIPIVLVVLLGAFDFGRVWTLSSATASAARVGAQFGVQSPSHAADSSGIHDAVVEALTDSTVIASGTEEASMGVEDFTIASNRYCQCSNGDEIDCTDKCSGSVSPAVFVRVQVDTTFRTLFDYRGIPNNIPIQRVAVLRAR
jgi:Flp pilus assembly protein TadG